MKVRAAPWEIQQQDIGSALVLPLITTIAISLDPSLRCEEGEGGGVLANFGGLMMEEEEEKDSLLETYSEASSASGFKEEVQSLLLQQQWPPHAILPILDVLKDLVRLDAGQIARVHELALQASQAIFDFVSGIGAEPSRRNRLASALLKTCIVLTAQNREPAFFHTCRQVLQMVASSISLNSLYFHTDIS